MTWFVLLTGAFVGGVTFARYALSEYEVYLERRSHGWQ